MTVCFHLFIDRKKKNKKNCVYKKKKVHKKTGVSLKLGYLLPIGNVWGANFYQSP